MFYGLNKFIKNILPKRLFYRALLIVAIPVYTSIKVILKEFLSDNEIVQKLTKNI